MKPIIIGVVAILILAGVIGGGLMASGVLGGSDLSAEEALSQLESSSSGQAVVRRAEPYYHEMTRPMLTNIADSRKMLQAKIALMTRNPDVVTSSIKLEYAIRAGVLELLGSLTEAETSTPTFRADLAIRLRDNVNQTLTQVTGNGGVEEVLFTELVVQ